MGTSRRQRSASEGTFLESVKCILQTIVKDLEHLKATIDTVKDAQVFTSIPVKQPWFCYDVHGPWLHDPSAWNTPTQWDALYNFADNTKSSPGGDECPQQGLDYCRSSQSAMLGKRVDNAIGRDVFLAYRFAERGSSLSLAGEQIGALAARKLPSFRQAGRVRQNEENSENSAASVIQHYYRKCVKTIALQSVWLPIEEWAVAVNSQQSPGQIEKTFGQHGCRDYDLGIWFQISPDNTPSAEAAVIWDEKHIERWARDTMEGAEGAPTLAGSAQYLLRSWGEASPHVPPSVRKVLAPVMLQHVERYRDLIVKGCRGSDSRPELLARLQSRMNTAMDLLDNLDAGRVSLRTHTRELIIRVLKETHNWLQKSPPTSEFPQKIKSFDNLTSIVSKERCQ